MHRRLFCELSPLAYRISVEKSCALRTLRDGFSAERFPKLRLEVPLPAPVSYTHLTLPTILLV